MKIPWRATRDRESLEISMTPMIDVVFLLLIFFVWTASFQVMEQLLPSSLLPAVGSGANSAADPMEMDFEMVVIRVANTGQQLSWTVNDNPQSDLTQLAATLAAVARVKNDLPVVVDPEPDVALGHVIDVYDITRRVGFAKIQFAAESLGE